MASLFHLRLRGPLSVREAWTVQASLAGRGIQRLCMNLTLGRLEIEAPPQVIPGVIRALALAGHPVSIQANAKSVPPRP